MGGRGGGGRGGRGDGGRGGRFDDGGRGGRGGRGRDGGGRGRDGGRDGGRGGGRDFGGGGRGGGGRGGGKPGRDDGPIADQQAVAQVTQMVHSMNLLSNVNTGLASADPSDPEKYQFARRPGLGSKGTKCSVVTNYYPVKFSPSNLMQYHMEVKDMPFDKETGKHYVREPDPGRPVKPIGTSILKLCLERLATVMKWKPCWAWDGRAKLYSTQQLFDARQLTDKKLQQEVSIPNPSRPHPTRFLVTLQLTGTVSLKQLVDYIAADTTDAPIASVSEQMNALEIILNHTYMMSDKQLYITRTFFKADQRGHSVGSGGEAWVGFKQDLRPCRFGLGLSVEPSFSVFYEAKPVIDYVEAVLSERGRQYRWSPSGMSKDDIKKAQKELKGLTVTAVHGKKQTFRCIGLSSKSAKEFSFDFLDRSTGVSKKTTVAAYFAAKGLRLKFPELPCVEGKGRNKQITAVPMELLSVAPGQKRRGLLIGDQQATLVRHAAQPPATKLDDIKRWAADAQAAWRPVKQAFGVDVGSELTTVQARLLPAPVLQYGRPTSYSAGTQGAWNMEGFQMKTAVTIKSWGICVLMDGRNLRGDQPGSLNHWMKMLNITFNELGIRTPDRPPQVHWCSRDPGRSPSYEAIEPEIDASLGKFGGNLPDVLFIIIPRKDVQYYKMIKGACDSQFGVVSQVIVASQASCLGEMRGDRGYSQNNHKQYLANVGLKVNHKLGGVNCSVKGFSAFESNTPDGRKACPPIWGKKPTMLIGIDVAHPQSFDKGEPSMVGIVASMDSSFGQYACRIKRVGHREEVVQAMKDDIKELLLLFQQRTRFKPEAIVVYRDGVSMGEFGAVLVKEYNAIRAACREMGDPSAEYCPPITYITVLKRHKARLFPGDQTSRDNTKHGNVKPGTCVDDGIVLKHGFDFYLNSHVGIQGTVKPAHYHVLCDENGFGPDAIQIATYWLCYTFCRCTRSVSYCPPAYYAHHVADRGRVLLHRDGGDDQTTTSGSDTDPSNIVFYPVNDALKDRMFFT